MNHNNVASSLYYRQLTQARDRIATGLKKLLETNDLVVNMEVSHVVIIMTLIGQLMCVYACTG